jgi:hypothetical protein
MNLYLDSMIWVYILEGNPIFGTPAREFFARVRPTHHEFLSSNLCSG